MIDYISIQQGFSNELRSSVGELYDAAFGAKLSIAMPNPVSRVEVLKQGLDPEFSFVAMSNGEMVGIAGFKTGRGSLTGGISFRILKDELGYWGAVRAVLVLALSQRGEVADQLLMDGISVSPKMRGSGIGTRLLQSLIEYAKTEGFRSIRLDVIDTNPAARRFYEREDGIVASLILMSVLRGLKVNPPEPTSRS